MTAFYRVSQGRSERLSVALGLSWYSQCTLTRCGTTVRTRRNGWGAGECPRMIDPESEAKFRWKVDLRFWWHPEPGISANHLFGHWRMSGARSDRPIHVREPFGITVSADPPARRPEAQCIEQGHGNERRQCP